ncbi:hypothetical protein [Polaromonas sp. CG9_12]|nr:hypothetical protein [Polaromonas sp. CG9_12]
MMRHLGSNHIRATPEALSPARQLVLQAFQGFCAMGAGVSNYFVDSA